MTPTPLILFDIDGTLVVPGDPAHGQALVDAFREITELEPDLSGISYAGMLDAQITRAFLERHEITGDAAEEYVAPIMQRMGELYETSVGEQSLAHRLLPGALAAVQAALERGWVVGTLTGNARHVAEVKLTASGFDNLTEVGAFGDAAMERWLLVQHAIESATVTDRPVPKPEHVVLIGDTPRDIEAAHRTGARIVAVATGRYDESALLDHGADSVLPNLEDTERFIQAVEAVLASEDRDAKTIGVQ